MRARTRARERGFTLIEVMMAIGIMTVGAVAIMAMVQAATRGSAEARMITHGTENAQMWVDRLQRVALRWTTDSQTGVSGIPYLNGLANAPATKWFTPGTANAADGVAALSWQGLPVAAGNREAQICTLLHLSWIVTGRSIRAEVISYYPRVSTGPLGSRVRCTATDDADALVADLANVSLGLGNVRTATVLRWRPIP